MYVTGRVLGSDWLKTSSTRNLPPEHAYHCLNKSLAINTHYDDDIMVSFITRRFVAGCKGAEKLNE